MRSRWRSKSKSQWRRNEGKSMNPLCPCYENKHQLRKLFLRSSQLMISKSDPYESHASFSSKFHKINRSTVNVVTKYIFSFSLGAHIRKSTNWFAKLSSKSRSVLWDSRYESWLPDPYNEKTLLFMITKVKQYDDKSLHAITKPNAPCLLRLQLASIFTSFN